MLVFERIHDDRLDLPFHRSGAVGRITAALAENP
jgi:hypothetical protein